MNETTRTLGFVSVAAVVCLVSWATSPAPPGSTGADSRASLSDLSDVGDANSLTIVRYDEDLAALDTFSVKRVRDRWVIPSHDNYPADAEEQLRKISSVFVELKAIDRVSEDPTTHREFGVVEPGDKLEVGARGVGRLITISDRKDQPLVNLIIGKKAESVDSTEQSAGEELRFVRVSGQPSVYVAKISLDALNPGFEKWIERDLLKMNVFDVKRVQLNDYSIIVVPQGNRAVASIVKRMDTTVSQGENNTWLLDAMKVYENNSPVDTQLAEDEELNKAKIDDVKTALDDLKIIDVERKPKILAEALQDDTLAQSREAITELQRFGFLVFRTKGESPEILGFNGSVQVALKDGLTYRLVFGRDKGADKEDSTKLNRYLMVQAEVDKSLIPAPELEPELPEPAGPAAPEASDEPAEDAAKGPDAKKADDAGTDAEKKDAGKKDEDKTEEEIRQEELVKKERERIKRDNQRKRDDHAEKIRKAEQRAGELNARFNDWFYVVSDDVYKKVQLSRADLVKDSGAASEGGFGPDAFRRLEREGIRGRPKAKTPPPPQSQFPQ